RRARSGRSGRRSRSRPSGGPPGGRGVDEHAVGERRPLRQLGEGAQLGLGPVGGAPGGGRLGGGGGVFHANVWGRPAGGRERPAGPTLAAVAGAAGPPARRARAGGGSLSS